MQRASCPSRPSRADRAGIILDRVAAGAEVRAGELARELGVSAATVRRDLHQLAEHRLLVRTHGGAVTDGRAAELPVRYRGDRNRAQKRAIAATAARLLPFGPLVLGLTGGTTARELARALTRRVDLTVVTNSLDIAVELYRHPRITVVVTGGTTRPQSGELVGPLVARTLAPMRLGVAVIGVDGLDDDGGLTTHDTAEALADAAMIVAARRTIVVADGSKLGRTFAARIAGVDTVHDLVTDAAAPAHAVARLREAGVRVHVCGTGAHPRLRT